MAEVSGTNVDGKTVRLGGPVASQTLHYDQLLVASGATYVYFGHDEWAAHAPGRKTLDDALAIRRRLLLAFEQAEAAASENERQAWLHFAMVGGGPTGVERAGTLAEIARHTLRQEFRQFSTRGRLRCGSSKPAGAAGQLPAGLAAAHKGPAGVTVCGGLLRHACRRHHGPGLPSGRQLRARRQSSRRPD